MSENTSSIYLNTKNNCKLTKGMKEYTSGPTKAAAVMKRRRRKEDGNPQEGCSTSHQVLGCPSKDEICISDGDVISGTADLQDYEDDGSTVPLVNVMQYEKERNYNTVKKFVKGSLKKKAKKRFNNDVDGSKEDSEGSEKIVEKWQRREPQQNLERLEKSSGTDDSVEEEQVEDDETVMAFRAKLADLPLSKVREIKEKLGLKLFNKAYFGLSKCDDSEKTMMTESEEMSNKYLGQHRPKEITSKKPVSTFRPVYQNMKTTKKRRDPRFDSRAGLYKERCFEDNYSFLNDLRKNEREELSKEALECEERGDLEMAAKIREIIRRMDNREKTKADRKLKQNTYQELRQENIERMMRGEHPVFKTKAKVKMINMEKKFAQLKKEGKLDQYMKRKAKKEARREARKKPSFEEKYGYH